MDHAGKNRSFLGLLLIIIGVVFLLDNLDLGFEIPWYLIKWPIVFIILGVINLASGNPRPAFFFFGFGIIFYLQVFGIIDFETYWPLIIIVVGLSFLIMRKGSILSSENSDDIFDETAIFGGGNRKFTSKSLKGGKITCLFGGLEIDLRDSVPDNNASIEIFCMFGGVEIIVPEDWKVNQQVTAIFGGFSDDRSKVSQDGNTPVHIGGFVMFGGCEMKN